MKQVIVGIDPGLTQSGVVAIEFELVDVGKKFETRFKVLDIMTPKSSRYQWYEKVEDFLFKFDIMVMELRSKYKLANREIKIAIELPVVRPKKIGWIFNQFAFVGAIIYELRKSYTVYTVANTTAKLALTNKGNAKKPEMVSEASMYIKLDTYTKAHKETISDAFAIALSVGMKLNGTERLV